MNYAPYAMITLALAATTGLHADPQARTATRAPAPVSVSSVNYADTPQETLARLAGEKLKANPVTPSVKALSQPQRYVFVPGELYRTDVSYEDLCKALTEVLAKKGFINAADEHGRIFDAEKVDLILRVNGGERPWMNPTVRYKQITWRDGLVERPVGRSLTTLGGDVAWNSRAGGNDSALTANAVNENAAGFGFGSSPGTPAGQNPLAQVQSQAGSSDYDMTKDFFLVVIDAFKYKDVTEKGKSAKRQWTTFIAAPRQPGQQFSEILGTMLRIATPYFGENTEGLQMYNDARATVNIREMEIVNSDVTLESKK